MRDQGHAAPAAPREEVRRVRHGAARTPGEGAEEGPPGTLGSKFRGTRSFLRLKKFPNWKGSPTPVDRMLWGTSAHAFLETRVLGGLGTLLLKSGDGHHHKIILNPMFFLLKDLLKQTVPLYLISYARTIRHSPWRFDLSKEWCDDNARTLIAKRQETHEGLSGV